MSVAINEGIAKGGGGRDQLLDNAQTTFPRCGHFWRVGIAELNVACRLSPG